MVSKVLGYNVAANPAEDVPMGQVNPLIEEVLWDGTTLFCDPKAAPDGNESVSWDNSDSSSAPVVWKRTAVNLVVDATTGAFSKRPPPPLPDPNWRPSLRSLQSDRAPLPTPPAAPKPPPPAAPTGGSQQRHWQQDPEWRWQQTW